MAGFADNRFQIPDNPGQEPAFDDLGSTSYDSSRLDENQQENTRFATLVLQGLIGNTSYRSRPASATAAWPSNPT